MAILQKRTHRCTLRPRRHCFDSRTRPRIRGILSLAALAFRPAWNTRPAATTAFFLRGSERFVARPRMQQLPLATITRCRVGAQYMIAGSIFKFPCRTGNAPGTLRLRAKLPAWLAAYPDTLTNGDL